MKYLVEFIQPEVWKQFQKDCAVYDQCLEQHHAIRQALFEETQQSYRLGFGEELTQAQFDKLSPDINGPDYPVSVRKQFESLKQAQEFAFLKKLEGYQTRIIG